MRRFFKDFNFTNLKKIKRIQKKYPFFIPSFLLCLIITSALIFVPNSNWKKIFDSRFDNLTTVFTSNNTWSNSDIGNWNDMNTWGYATRTIPFSLPIGVAVSPSSGDIYVSDYLNNRIVILNPDLSFSSSTSVMYPRDLALSTSGDIYIGSTIIPNSNIIVIINSENLSNSSTFAVSEINFTYHIALSASGNIYVSENSNKISVINSDHTFSTSTQGMGLNLNNVKGMAVSQAGEIYASAQVGGQNRIIVLNPDLSISTTSPILEFLSNPIAISSSGDIYVTDGYRIVVFNPNFSFLAESSLELGLNSPGGIAISLSGDIYVTDSNHNRLVVLNPDLSFSTSTDGVGDVVPVEGLNYPGANDDVVLNTGTVVLSQDQSVHSLTLENGGTLDLNGHTLNIYGNWKNTGGTLINNGGTVNFTGTSIQKISGENTFENLTKISSTTSSLLFDTTATTTILNNLTLSGSPNNLLTIGLDTGSVVPQFVSRIGGLGATISGFSRPADVALSTLSEYIYVMDSGNSRIIVLNPDGSFSTTTDPALGLSQPYKITISQSGDIYIADFGNNRVVVLNPDFSFSTTSDPGLGLYQPQGIALSSGKIYISDTLNNRIVVLNPNLSLSTTSDPGLGLNNPVGINISASGDIYIADAGNNRIVVLNPDLSLLTTTDPGLGLNFPEDVIPFISGDIYIADSYTNRIVILNPDLSLSTTTDLGLGLNYPEGIAISSRGDVYIADANNNRIVVLNSDLTASTTYYNSVPESFVRTYGVTHNNLNHIYASDSETHSIQEFDSSGHFIKFLNTTGIPEAGLIRPAMLSIDSQGNIYTVDYGDIPNFAGGRIIKFDSSGNYSTSSMSLVLASGIAVDSSGYIYVTDWDMFGDQSNIYGIIKLDSNFNIIATTTEANGTTYSFYYGGADVDSTGNYLYVEDGGNNRIVKLNTSNLSFVSETYGPSEAPFTTPSSVQLDSVGNIYVSDTGNNRIVKLAPDFSYLTQWGTAGSEDGQFSTPAQLTVDSDNNVYVVDQENARIQKFSQSPSAPPFNIFLSPSATSSLSYLSVSNSHNSSESPLPCLMGCVNVGYNSNWTFPTPPASTSTRRRHVNRTIINETSPISEDVGGNTESESELETTPVISTTTTNEELNTTTSEKTTTAGAITNTTQIVSTGLQLENNTTSTFTRSLSVRSSGNDVAELQKRLTAEGVYSGPITGYFGPLTRAAIIKYQMKHGINPLGIVGPITRATLSAKEPSNYIFQTSLKLNSTGIDVIELQKRLTALGFYSGPVTGYFGSRTKIALIHFQEENYNSILKPLGLKDGTGIFGNYTRKFINSL